MLACLGCAILANELAQGNIPAMQGIDVLAPPSSHSYIARS